MQLPAPLFNTGGHFNLVRLDDELCLWNEDVSLEYNGKMFLSKRRGPLINVSVDVILSSVSQTLYKCYHRNSELNILHFAL